MTVGAVILAAGHQCSTSKFQPMLPIGGTTVIKRIILTLTQAGIAPIVVVTGCQGDELEKHISKMRVICLRNEDYDTTPMFESIRMGLSYIENLCDRVLVMPTKFPLFLSETLSQMLSCDSPVVCPIFEGQRGHPVLINRECIADILSFEGSGGLGGSLRQKEIEQKVSEISVEDKGIIRSVGTDEDYEGILLEAKEDKIPMYTSMRLFIGKDEVFFGPGIAQFLSLVEHTGSMQTACKQMHMSYSKGWKIVKTAQIQLGYPLLMTQVGGSEGGYSELTENGKSFLKRYLQMENELTKETERLFMKYFGGEDS